jgi:hypothetical protein
MVIGTDWTKDSVCIKDDTHTKKLIQTEMRIELPCGSVKHKTEKNKNYSFKTRRNYRFQLAA